MLRDTGKETNCAGRRQNAVAEMYVTNHTNYILQPKSLRLRTCSKKSSSFKVNIKAKPTSISSMFN